MTVFDASYAEFVGASIQRAHRDLAERWLERLVALLPVDPNAVFSTELLLDHIPALLDEIGKFVGTPGNEDIAANARVLEKARELGQLRHQQQASLHQVLREYDLLGEVLEQFVIDQTTAATLAPTAAECLELCRRVNRAVRIVMQMTAVMFITAYTETITDQAQRLDRFNRSISHELRNVLGTLQFGAVLLEANIPSSNDADRQRLAATMRRNAERAVKIVRSFERLPRSGIVADKPTEQVVDLTELVQEVFRQLQEMAQVRNVELRLGSPLSVLYLDTGALELVLINLVSNAIKYSDPTKAARFVEVVGRNRVDAYEMFVRDNGIGIPSAAVLSIFQRFVRAHPQRDEELGVEGTGLGLAIVEECVKALGGQISLESEEGAGTTVSITIPKKLPPLAMA